MSVLQISLAGTVIVLGAIVQGTLGFGLGLLAAPFLALLNPELVPGPLLIATLAVALPTLLADVRVVNFSEMSWAILGRVPGNIAGVVAIAIMSTRWLVGFVGVSILAGLAMQYYRPASTTITPSRMLMAGAASGFMGTTTSVGAPPMAMLYARQGGVKLRASMSAFFAAGLVLSIGMLGIGGQLDSEKLQAGLLLMPFVLAGWGASLWARRFIAHPQRVYTIVVTISGIAAVVLILRAIFG